MLKKVVFYITVSLTIFLFGIILLRFLIYLVIWLFTGYHVWFDPSLCHI